MNISIRPSICVVITAFNEEPSLAEVVHEIGGELAKLGHACEMLIVNDGSSDSTGAIADNLALADGRIRVIHHPKNMGIGPVFLSGFEHCGMDLITYFPADGQFPATIIPQFMRHFVANETDMVLGYIENYEKSRSWLARFLSWGERVLVFVMFGNFPKFQGIMMFRHKMLETINITSKGRGWIVQMEVIIRFHRAGCRIIREATLLRPRMSGTSKATNIRSVYSNLRQLFALRLNM